MVTTSMSSQLAAQLLGLAQLALFGLLARSVRWRTLVIAVGAGLVAGSAVIVMTDYVLAPALGALIVVAALGAVAAQLLALAPMVLLWRRVATIRWQWGLTDALLLSASVATGFGIAETLLSYAGTAAQFASATEAWRFATVGAVPGPVQLLFSWMPFGAMAGPFGGSLSMPAAWGVIAGLGLALLLLPTDRPGRRGPYALAGSVLVLYALGDQLALNTSLVASSTGGWWTAIPAAPFTALRSGIGLWVTLCLLAAVLLDRRQIDPGVSGLPGLRLRDEPHDLRRRLVLLVRLAGSGLPWSLPVVCDFVRLRRAYVTALGRDIPEDVLTENRQRLTRRIAALDRAAGPDGKRVWRLLAERQRERYSPALLRARVIAAVSSTGRRVLLAIWLVLAALPGVYFLVASYPTASAVLRVSASPVVAGCYLVAVLAAAIWSGWTARADLRQWRTLRESPGADPAAAVGLLIMLRLGLPALALTTLAAVLIDLLDPERFSFISMLLAPDAAAVLITTSGIMLGATLIPRSAGHRLAADRPLDAAVESAAGNISLPDPA